MANERYGDFYPRFPDELKQLRQWVGVKMNEKMPLKGFDPASSSNPATWSSYEEVGGGIEKGYYDNAGFVFDNNGIVGIDIDDGFDEDGFLSTLAIDVMKQCRSYTEYSRSGRGMHIYVKGTLPFGGRNNLKGVEIYQDGRFFIVTGKVLIFDEIVKNQPAIDYILKKYFTDIKKSGQREQATPNIYQPIYKRGESGRVSLQPEYPEIRAGGRNISLASLAGQLHNQGYPPKAILEEITKVNETKCKPPLDMREIRTIVKSITRYER